MNRILYSFNNNFNLPHDKFYKYSLLLLTSYLLFRRLFLPTTKESFFAYYKRIFYKYLIYFPIIGSELKKKVQEGKNNLHNFLMDVYKEEDFIEFLPENSLNANKVLEKINHYNNLKHFDWINGKVSGGIYLDYTKKDHLELIKEVFMLTAYSNPLHIDVFPNIRKMEAEIIKIVINLYNGNKNTVGTLTSGGTESIILACKAYRDWARSERNIRNPVILVPETVHAAFNKASQLLDIKIEIIPIDYKTMKVNVNKMKKAINKNVCLLVGSSPNFPHGIVDPMNEIINLGLKYNIPVHMDACLGGFLLPFLFDTDFEIIDFKKKGLTSISIDTHKYAFAPKGTSILLYSDPVYRHFQYFNVYDWPGGIYATPTIAGSRVGSSIATCWATLLFFGKKYYIESTKKILETSLYIKNELKSCKEIFIYGDPVLSIIALGSNTFNIFDLNDHLAKKGWSFNSIQKPNGFHICITLMHTLPGIKEQLVNDIKNSIDYLLKNKNLTERKGIQAIYGISATIPDKSFMNIFVLQYLDSYYSTKKIK